ncbi:ubiquinone/menaquinone biosynthesis C-methylase UbiE [Saccharothrix carnea]|uniref:Ubiquinone/menaquinone biosynthesis C-methylase UbiE n=1 Tax=Saccharothrix carnea TaxID=1280637 RepID=A0A2P8HCY8_SACCR|nr:methyltransferase domain-containing protein [Saccharothrix carnea]PSL44105.1 ubiquinone/menaquinone biosynthesis C-methylase UbiE [Saccharothrix carnea]
MTTQYVPSSAEVVAFYDNALPLIANLAGDNVHYGYWHSREDTSTLHEAMDNLTDVMIERLGVTAGRRVLDVGCGLGAPAQRLARARGVEVVGISTSPAMVREATARARAAGLGGQVRFEVADAEHLPFEDASFDAAWAIESLVHMADRPRVFREIGRVLRPGGRLALTDFYERIPFTGERLTMIEEYRRAALNTPFHRLEEYPPMLRDAGLHLIEYLDISEQTDRHYPMLLERLRAHRDELTAAYGAETVAALDSVFTNCARTGEPHYMLMTAYRS